MSIIGVVAYDNVDRTKLIDLLKERSKTHGGGLLRLASYHDEITVIGRDENGIESHNYLDKHTLKYVFPKTLKDEDFKRINFGSYGNNKDVYRNVKVFDVSSIMKIIKDFEEKTEYVKITHTTIKTEYVELTLLNSSISLRLHGQQLNVDGGYAFFGAEATKKIIEETKKLEEVGSKIYEEMQKIGLA